MSIFERFRTLWVGLCILAGIVLGNVFPDLSEIVVGGEYAAVSEVPIMLSPVAVASHTVDAFTRRDTDAAGEATSSAAPLQEKA